MESKKNVREKLIELLKHEFGATVSAITADWLLANGVTMLPDDCVILTRQELAELTKHNHGLTGTRLYSIWRSMRQRCNSPQNKDFKSYGARGVTICRDWDYFLNFYNWALSHGYADDLTLDRIDVDGNYSPDNCRWTDRSVQSKNRRFTQIEFNGESHSIAEWSKITGISNSGIRYRLQQNYPIEKVLKRRENEI